jgi:hypothetical protein
MVLEDKFASPPAHHADSDSSSAGEGDDGEEEEAEKASKARASVTASGPPSGRASVSGWGPQGSEDDEPRWGGSLTHVRSRTATSTATGGPPPLVPPSLPQSQPHAWAPPTAAVDHGRHRPPTATRAAVFTDRGRGRPGGSVGDSDDNSDSDSDSSYGREGVRAVLLAAGTGIARAPAYIGKGSGDSDGSEGSGDSGDSDAVAAAASLVDASGELDAAGVKLTPAQRRLLAMTLGPRGQPGALGPPSAGPPGPASGVSSSRGVHPPPHQQGGRGPGRSSAGVGEGGQRLGHHEGDVEAEEEEEEWDDDDDDEEEEEEEEEEEAPSPPPKPPVTQSPLGRVAGPV